MVRSTSSSGSWVAASRQFFKSWICLKSPHSRRRAAPLGYSTTATTSRDDPYHPHARFLGCLAADCSPDLFSLGTDHGRYSSAVQSRDVGGADRRTPGRNP